MQQVNQIQSWGVQRRTVPHSTDSTLVPLFLFTPPQPKTTRLLWNVGDLGTLEDLVRDDDRELRYGWLSRVVVLGSGKVPGAVIEKLARIVRCGQGIFVLQCIDLPTCGVCRQYRVKPWVHVYLIGLRSTPA